MNVDSTGKGSKGYKAFAAIILFLFVLELIASFFLFAPQALAAEVSKGKRTFKVSAYYSPLPGQKKYLRGTYEAEIRLNGEGVRGASGALVHPGMIAAPKAYPFGTKIYLEGLGIGTVEDRGGAIVPAGTNGHDYDRLDVWMGSGDEGLERALNWGIRVVEGEILGLTADKDTISFGAAVKEPVVENTIKKEEALKLQSEVDDLASKEELLNSFPVNIGLGTSGEHVKLVQVAFKKLGYYKGEIDGVYNDDLVNAVLTFQVAKQIVSSPEDVVAGYFGLKTRMVLIEILLSKQMTIDMLLSEASKAIPSETKQETAPMVTFKAVSQMEIPVLKEKTVVAVNKISSVPLIKNATVTLASTVDFKVPALSAELVEEVQAKLLLMGYNPGPVTGKYTAKTLIAVKEFERNNDMPVTGKLSPEVAHRIHAKFFAKEHTIADSVKKSKLLTSVQVYLQKKGLYKDPVDGALRTSLSAAAKAYMLRK